MPVKKILIADDHALTRRGTELLIHSVYPRVEILEANNGQEVIAQYESHKPEIIITDYSMPVMNGLEAARILLKKDKQIKIILLTMFDSVAVALNFIKIGGRGFISKGSDCTQIVDAIRAVSIGDYFCSSANEKDILKYLLEGVPRNFPKLNFTRLELAIVVKLSIGKTSKEISQELNISVRTVETYRYDLIKKTGVKNSVELIEYVYKNGIMEMR